MYGDKVENCSSPNGGVDDFPGYIELIESVEVVTAVSFDFFDTLFIRPLACPEDVFEIIELQFNMPDFRSHRHFAQTVAFQQMQAAGRKEITLEDIYACFPKGKISPVELMEAEYALESSLVEPNPELIGLFERLLKVGKTVVITSDMYLPGRFFEQALRNYGLSQVPLFISSDRNATKRDAGELFDIVSRELSLPAKEILHIGDDHLADFLRPREKGMHAFQFQPQRAQEIGKKRAPLSQSIACGLARTLGLNIEPNSFAELGFVYGGAAMLGFFEWIKEQARHDNIDQVLFLSRDGYGLERIARAQADRDFPKFSYFFGSRTAFTLAVMNADNFKEFIPFLLSGGIGLAPHELLERIGVCAPSPNIMNELELGENVQVATSLYDKLASFLFAYRWEILRICQRNRHALFQYLHQLGLKNGSRIALVDVGWSGTTQESFEMAVKPMMKLDTVGYYFCLADTPECQRRKQMLQMVAMVTAENTSEKIIADIYANRVGVEQFFSAPHPTVIGWQSRDSGVDVVFDAGRGATEELPFIVEEIVAGMDLFIEHYRELTGRLCLSLSPLQMAWPLIELVTEEVKHHKFLKDITSFDTWASSCNHRMTLTNDPS